jgi:hypothetical protein
MPNLGNFTRGLPALLGVVFGIRVYTGGLEWLVICAALLAAAIAALTVGRAVIKRYPVAGGWIIETWIMSPICATALSTALIVWLSALGLPTIFGSEPDEDIRKSVAATFVGAVTTYAAIVWTKDIEEGTGIFWPSTQFKTALAAVQKELSNAGRAPPGGSIDRQAMVSDIVETSPKIVGWDFSARRRRARMVQEYIGSKNDGHATL